MKLKTYHFAPGVIEFYPRRRRPNLSADAVLELLILGVALAMTAVSASIGWAIGGML